MVVSIIYVICSLQFLGENLQVECLEQGFVESESLRFGEEEEEANFSIPSVEDKMPFLHMLQSAESLNCCPTKLYVRC